MSSQICFLREGKSSPIIHWEGQRDKYLIFFKMHLQTMLEKEQKKKGKQYYSNN